MSKLPPQPNLKLRIAATIIDYGICMTFWVWYVYQFGSPNDKGGYSVNGWPALILFSTWFLYFPIVEGFKGQTIGHLLCGLKVVTLSGKSISISQALVRRIADSFELFSTFGLIAFLTVRNTNLNQRVGDLWAKTTVIGGETARCSNCAAELSLTFEETIKGSFECAECGTKQEK
ncbi:RDD family protein [Marinoscillum pacificum]|uniref:RDD family protein n=1 Tax=Marinoscillum pacificum TaxID=392723 RepID=UPI00215884A2|nr:RDD family protein [Marinoscillum pacificum]